MGVGLLFLNVNAAKKGSILHINEEKRNAQQSVCYNSIYLISIQHAWNTLPLHILPLQPVKPVFSIFLNTERSYITRLNCSACQSLPITNGKCNQLAFGVV